MTSSKTICYLTDLPDEFSLNGYDDTPDKPPSWWAEQLSQRAAKLAWSKLPQHELLSKEERSKIQLRAFTNYKIRNADKLEGIEWGTISTPIISKLTYAEIRWLNRVNSSKHDLEYISSDSSTIEYLTVNIEASNDTILDEFQQFLIEVRERKNLRHSKPAISKAKLKKLSKYRILPLIDCLHWEVITGNKIKRSALAMLLFPEGTKGERELTDTIIPLAKKALTTRFMNDLVRID